MNLKPLLNVRTAHAVLAGAQILTAGTTLADILGLRTAGLIVLIVGACQGAIAAYQVGSAPAATPPGGKP